MSIESDLASIWPVVERMTAARVRDPNMVDDCIQEGMIAAWQLLETGAPPGHAVQTARYRVRQVLSGRPLFGSEGHPGRQDAHDFSRPLVALSHDGEEFLVSEPVDLSAEDAIAAVGPRLLATSAAASLSGPDRVLVHLRFWEDLTAADSGERVGMSRQQVERRWLNHIRPALREALKEAS